MRARHHVFLPYALRLLGCFRTVMHVMTGEGLTDKRTSFGQHPATTAD